MNTITTGQPAVKPVNLAEALEEAGYRPGAPPHITEATRRIDRLICRRRKCGECGKRGLGYLPYTGLDGRSYHVIAVCPRCGNQEEL